MDLRRPPDVLSAPDTNAVAALARGRAPWPALAGFVLWTAALAAAHLWVVAQASASA